MVSFGCQLDWIADCLEPCKGTLMAGQDSISWCVEMQTESGDLFCMCTVPAMGWALKSWESRSGNSWVYACWVGVFFPCCPRTPDFSFFNLWIQGVQEVSRPQSWIDVTSLDLPLTTSSFFIWKFTGSPDSAASRRHYADFSLVSFRVV